MKPIKVAILWHYHQPYYRKEDQFILPWVRTHGVKDYWDIPELFYEFPDIRQTINVVPALQQQINEYVSEGVKDRVQILCEKKAVELTQSEKEEILNQFFVLNYENLIQPSPRYSELLDKKNISKGSIENFSDQDWLDLQVWYNLAWTGQYSRRSNFIRMMVKKDRNFTEGEKLLLLEHQLKILGGIDDQFRTLAKLGMIDISVTPYYHPILPLLINTDSAQEAKVGMELPEERFSRREDADEQIRRAMKYAEEELNHKAKGMWPSEGSISNEALQLMSKAGIKWAAGDEQVLKNSSEDYNDLHKYFPQRYKSDEVDITLFFRDHNLSDAIGFIYSNWDPGHAAYDLANKIKDIRNRIIDEYGESALDHAIVSIILDGENCWEFYPDNGIHFLRHMFTRISDEEVIETVLFSDVYENNKYLKSLRNIKAGSWINGNFDIWIGHSEHRIAWSELSKLRELMESRKEELGKKYDEALEEMYIAEGSDWFWWYGDAHNAPNKSDFDKLFRWRLRKIYSIIGEEHPEVLNSPIGSKDSNLVIKQAENMIYPVINGKVEPEDEWDGSGFFNAKSSGGDMHQVGSFLNKVFVGNNSERIFIRLDVEELDPDKKIILKIGGLMLNIDYNKFSFQTENNVVVSDLDHSIDEVLEISLSMRDLSKDLKMSIETTNKDKLIRYPRQGELHFKLI